MYSIRKSRGVANRNRTQHPTRSTIRFGLFVSCIYELIERHFRIWVPKGMQALLYARRKGQGLKQTKDGVGRRSSSSILGEAFAGLVRVSHCDVFAYVACALQLAAWGVDACRLGLLLLLRRVSTSARMRLPTHPFACQPTLGSTRWLAFRQTSRGPRVPHSHRKSRRPSRALYT